MQIRDDAAHSCNANLQVPSECPTKQQQWSDPEVHSDTVGTPPEGASFRLSSRDPLQLLLRLSVGSP